MTALELQQAIFAALSPVFAGRLYPLAAVEGAALPYAVMAIETASTENTLCGRSDLTNYRYRVDIYAMTMVELLTFRPQVLNVMDAFGIPLFETEFYEPEIRAMRRVMDFSIWRKE